MGLTAAMAQRAAGGAQEPENDKAGMFPYMSLL